MIDIHFPFLDDRKPVLPLVAACGLRPFESTAGVSANKFDKLAQEGPRWFRPSPIERAQLVFYPHCASNCLEVYLTAKAAQEHNLPCIFVKHGDDALPLNVPYGIVYKESQFHSLGRLHERVIPPFIDDPQSFPEVANGPRAYESAPVVGFCGFVGSLAAFPSYYIMGRREKRAGMLLRRRAIRALRRSKDLHTNFIPRRQYWGGAVRLTRRRIQLIFNHVIKRSVDVDASRNFVKERRVHTEFLDNMFSSDYTLCARGAGNYSYRFYETLAAGRIPLFINTDCSLPFQDHIQWKKHCVWVEAGAVDHIADTLVGFHRSLTRDTFLELQLSNRRLYEELLNPVSFYKRALSDAINSVRSPKCEV